MTEYLAYERLRNAITALGGSLEHRREGGPQGGAWVLRLGGYMLEVPCEAARFQDLDRCYRPRPGIPFPKDFGDYTNEIDPAGMARLFERLVRTSPSMARTGAASAALPAQDHQRLEARLKERLAVSTRKVKKTTGYAPTRWLEMEREHGSLGACQLILAECPKSVWVEQLTPMWENNLLRDSVEAIALESEFERLFTDMERRIAKERLKEFGFEPQQPRSD